MNETGVAFGVEKVGGIDLILSDIKSKISPNARKRLRTRKIGNKEIPWFYSVGIDYKDTTITHFTWVMEYHKDYMKNMFPDIIPKDKITREHILSRRFDKTRLFKNIYETTIALDEKQQERFIKELMLFGYTIERSGDKKICKGPGIKFILIHPVNSICKITELKISLLQEKEGKKIYRFGETSTLQFKGTTATWKF